MIIKLTLNGIKKDFNHMRIIITGSSGYLGKALVKKFNQHHDVIGIDISESHETTVLGSITDKNLIEKKFIGADAIIHTAALHKPQIITHSKQQFIDVNVTGTQNLLEIAIKYKIKTFIYTSTTSLFGSALSPADGKHTVWVNEELIPVPKNIYGVTKIAAENLCQLAHQECDLNIIILRTSRFFPKDCDIKNITHEFSEENIQAIEYLHRRVNILDAVNAHEKAIERASEIGFDKFIVSFRQICIVSLKRHKNLLPLRTNNYQMNLAFLDCPVKILLESCRLSSFRINATGFSK